MMVLYKPNIEYLTEHAVDPDKRRYMIAQEGPRHFIDIDNYAQIAFDSIPRTWKLALNKYSEDSLLSNGIVPWWIQTMLYRLTRAFEDKDKVKILKLSAEIGHYLADAHVPLHASSNHNGQKTGQQGIHGFWESRIPELLADKEFDFLIGKAEYISNPVKFIWSRIHESAKAADSVLQIEKELTRAFPSSAKFSFEERNGVIVRQYSSGFTIAYHNKLNGMVERRMRQSIFAIASFWYTAWVNAGQPDLKKLAGKELSPEDIKEFDELNNAWKKGAIKGRDHE